MSQTRAREALLIRNHHVTTHTRTISVLCVDDDPHVLSFVTDSFNAAGFEVQTAVDGSHALQKIATAEPPYDVLVVDGRMPNLDGWRFVMHVRSGGFEGKIIIFSAHLDEYQLQRYRELMVDRVIQKPLASGELIAAVRELTLESSATAMPGTM